MSSTDTFNGLFYPYKYGTSKYGTLDKNSLPTKHEDIIGYEGSLFIEIVNRFGNTIDRWYFQQEKKNNLIIKFNFRSEGAGEIKFYNLNKRIMAGDILIYTLNGITRYKGIFLNNVSLDSQTGRLGYIASPLKRQPVTLKLYNRPVLEAITAVFENVGSKTGIKFDPDLIDTGAVDPITIDYKCTPAWEVLQDINKFCSGRYIGVTTDLFFYMRKEKKSEYDFLFYNENPAYQKIDFPDNDYSRAKYTRAEVWRNSVKIGDVGASKDFPPLEIEKYMPVTWGKLTPPDVLSDNEALRWSYGKLKETTKPRQDIKITGVDKRYSPQKGDYVFIQSQRKRGYYTLIDIPLRGVYGWTAAKVTPKGGYYGETCIEIFDSSDTTFYDFGTQTSFYKQEYIGFWLKGNRENILKIGVGKTRDTIEYSEHYVYSDEWIFINFPVSIEFRFLSFKKVNNFTNPIIIDEIGILAYSFTTASKQVKLVRDSLSKHGLRIDIECGTNSDDLNEDFAELEEKIRVIKES